MQVHVIINSEKHTLVQKIFKTYKTEPHRQKKFNWSSSKENIFKVYQREVTLNYILLSGIQAEWSFVNYHANYLHYFDI